MTDLIKANFDRRHVPILAPKKPKVSVDAFQRAFGNLLNRMRRKRNKSQNEFSIPQRTVRRVEKGDSQITSALDLFCEMNPCHKEVVEWTRLMLELAIPECSGCDPDCPMSNRDNSNIAYDLEESSAKDGVMMERSMVKNLLELNPYGIAIWDEEGRYVRSNHAYIKLFATPPPEFVTLFDSPSLKKAGMQDLFFKLKSGVTIHLAPFWHNSRDVGEEYPDNPICIGAVMFPLKDQRGVIRYYVTMFEDITQRVLAEDRLKEALKFKSDFMATVSHELRTPLSGIISSATLVLRDDSLQLSERRASNVKNILGNADKLVLMINNILDVARMGAGGTHVTPQYFSIMEVIRTSVEFFRGLIDEKSLDVSWDVNDDMPILYNDRQMIGQIINNLVGNAVKFTDSGSIHIRACVNENDRDRFDISVKDTGVGIPQDMFDKIFDHFSRVDNSSTREHYGIGMGLSIVKGYVNLLGGKIKVESEPMKGSNFTVTLPMALAGDAT